jgi:hypothetical protein
MALWYVDMMFALQCVTAFGCGGTWIVVCTVGCDERMTINKAEKLE